MLHYDVDFIVIWYIVIIKIKISTVATLDENVFGPQMSFC